MSLSADRWRRVQSTTIQPPRRHLHTRGPDTVPRLPACRGYESRIGRGEINRLPKDVDVGPASDRRIAGPRSPLRHRPDDALTLEPVVGGAKFLMSERQEVAATCLTSVSSDGQLTSASSMFELQRRLCDVKRAHAGVSAIPGHDPKRYLDSIETRPSRYPLRESKPELARRWNYPPGSQPALRKPSSQCWNTASSRTGIKERAACSEVKPGIRARNCSSASRASSNLPS